jgi:hypothetical protein
VVRTRLGAQPKPSVLGVRHRIGFLQQTRSILVLEEDGSITLPPRFVSASEAVGYMRKRGIAQAPLPGTAEHPPGPFQLE